MSHTKIPDDIKTPVELIKWMNNTFGMAPWPRRMIVKPALYGHCCQYVFDAIHPDYHSYIKIAVGLANGLMFKNVELILTDK